MDFWPPSMAVTVYYRAAEIQQGWVAYLDGAKGFVWPLLGPAAFLQKDCRGGKIIQLR